MKLEERLGTLLREKKLTIALAESCTGGLISSRITDVAGSSDYFEAGVVVYSNQAKQKFLSVPAESLQAYGAVSKEVAEKMAEGARLAMQTDIGVSVTGIARPSGGSPEKPVGLVYVGVASSQGTYVRRFHFEGSRLDVKARTADAALQLAIDLIEGRLS